MPKVHLQDLSSGVLYEYSAAKQKEATRKSYLLAAS